MSSMKYVCIECGADDRCETYVSATKKENQSPPLYCPYDFEYSFWVEVDEI